MSTRIRYVVLLAVTGALAWLADASPANAQVPVTVYYPSQASVAYVPVRTGLFGRRISYRPAVTYSTPAVVTPVTTYYAPSVAAPVTTYYAPSVATPVTTYYAPSVATPVTTYYAPAPVTTYYAPRRVRTYYAPMWAY